MNKINIEYGLIKTFCPSNDPISCSDDKCHNVIRFMDNCFIDRDGSIFCISCGQCQRYERKKAAEREKLGLPKILINGE